MTPEQFAADFTRAIRYAMSPPLTAQSWRGWKTIRELYPLQQRGENQSSHYTFCAWEAHGKAERRRRDGCVYEWRLL